MLKKLTSITTILAMFLTSTPVLAEPGLMSGTLETPGIQRTLFIPPNADNSPVISLGTSVDPVKGDVVEGFAIIHYKKSPAHKTGGSHAKTTQCYKYLASGAKWKWVESWVVNPTNTRGLEGNFVFNTLTSGIGKWEDAADGVMGNAGGVNVLGDGAITSDVLVADTSSPDGNNEVYFANVSDPGAIAVTIVWGIFSGPTFQRKLVEWDQVYDDVDYDWSSAGEAGKMDFENIGVHELGHSFGMADLYTLSCPEETMYGYADFGETKKRDLNTGDIIGINKLY